MKDLIPSLLNIGLCVELSGNSLTCAFNSEIKLP